VALEVWRRGRSKMREWKESVVTRKKLVTQKNFRESEAVKNVAVIEYLKRC
jgi:hypothetical protein